MTYNEHFIADLLKAVHEAKTDEGLVRATLDLVKTADAATEAVEKAKIRLRQIATERAEGQPGTVTIYGPAYGGTITVTIPKPSLRFTGDRDALREALGDRYDTYFREKVVVSLAPEFRALVEATEDVSARVLLTGAVAEADLPPRVSFRPTE